MKMFLLNRQSVVEKWLSDDDFLEAVFIEAINAAGELKFSLPLKKRLASELYYAAIPQPIGDGYVLFKIITEDLQNDRIEYTGIEAAYDELKAYDYIKDVRPKNQSAAYMLQRALADTRWVPGVTYGNGEVSTNFYYITPLEAIQKIVELFDVEVNFEVIIDPKTNRITKRMVNLYREQGRRTGKRFEYGSNLLTISREANSTNLITAMIGRGKGEQVSDGNDETPDGYGRRITFADVVWSKANGDPVDKPAGQEWVEDPEATAQYGFDDGTPRFGHEVFEDITEPAELLKATWAALQANKRPQVSFKANVMDVGDLKLGDTVAIIRHDIRLEYLTRVYKVEHNLLNERLNAIELGDDLSSNSITSQVNYVKGQAHDIKEMTVNALTSANGKNTNYYGKDQPANPVEGDLWYKDLGNGETDLYQYIDGAWVLLVSTWAKNTAKKEVDKAREEFNAQWQAAQISDEELEKKVETQRQAIEKEQAEAKSEFDQKWRAMQLTDEQLQKLIDNNNANITNQINADRTNFEAQLKNFDTKYNNRVNQAQQSADGKNKIFYSASQPREANSGDTWFKDNGDGSLVTYVYNNDTWKSVFDTSQTAVKLLTTGQDLNNLTESHLYFIQSTANTNTPEGKTNWCYVDVKKASGSRITQTWIADNDQKMAYQRVYTNGSWSTWSRTVTNDDVIALINASQERTVIDGSKIHITGRTLIDNGVINNAMIANLDAGKITSGIISANQIGGRSITGDKIAVGTITSDLIKAGTIGTDKLMAGQIDGSIIKADTLAVGALKAGTIDGTKMTMTHINASNIDTGDLNANLIKTGWLNADRINGGTLDFRRIIATNISAYSITSGAIDATKVTVANINASNINTGTLNGNLIKAHSIGTDQIVTSGLSADAITTGTMKADRIYGGELNAANVNLINVNVNSLVGDKSSFIQSYWNGISSYININSSRLRAGSSANGYIELGWNGMHVFDSYNNEEMGWIHGNHYVGHPEQNGLVFDLQYPNGDYMAWAMQEQANDNYNIQMELRRSNWNNKQAGLNIYSDVKFHGYIYPSDVSTGFGALKLVRAQAKGVWGTALLNKNGKSGLWIGDNDHLCLFMNGKVQELTWVKFPTEINDNGIVQRWEYV